MPKLIENYSIGEQIGEGAYGKVYKAKHILTNQSFAVKVISVQKFRQNQKLKQCCNNEKKTLTTIRPCKHIIKYITEFRTENNCYIVYEYCNGGTLESMLKKQKHFSEAKAFAIFKQLLEAFKVLHQYNIIHRDTKPESILFHNGIVKLGDFGFCKEMDNKTDMTATMLGSPIYMAPEVLKGQQYTNKIDIWSLGAVLYEMLFGICPFQSKSIVELISTIRDTQVRFPLQINQISEETQYLIRRMLVKQVDYRMRWEELFALNFGQSDDAQTYKEKEIEKQKQRQRQREIEKQRQRQRQKEKSRQRQRERQKERVRQRERQRQREKSTERQKQRFESFKQRQRSLDRTTSSGGNGTNYNLLGFSYDSNFKPMNKASLDTLPSMAPQFAKYSQLKNSKSYGLTGSAVIFSPPARRKAIVQEHQFCTKGIKVSIDIINTSDKNTLAYSFLILNNVKIKLRKIKDSISYGDSELQDISNVVTSELETVQCSAAQLKEQLQKQNFDLKMISDVKIYLSVKFREFDSDIKVWYEMVNFLLGDHSFMSTRDRSREQMIAYIRQKLK